MSHLLAGGLSAANGGLSCQRAPCPSSSPLLWRAQSHGSRWFQDLAKRSDVLGERASCLLRACVSRHSRLARSLQMGSQRDSTATRHAEAALRDNITGQLAPFHPAACVGHDSEVAEQRCRWMGPTDSASTDLSPRICIPRPIISAGAGFDSLVGGARPTTSSSFHGARRCLEPMPSRCLSCRSSTLPHPPNPHHVHLIRCVWPLACAGRHHHHPRRAWPRRRPHRREMRFFLRSCDPSCAGERPSKSWHVGM